MKKIVHFAFLLIMVCFFSGCVTSVDGYRTNDYYDSYRVYPPTVIYRHHNNSPTPRRIIILPPPPRNHNHDQFRYHREGDYNSSNRGTRIIPPPIRQQRPQRVPQHFEPQRHRQIRPMSQPQQIKGFIRPNGGQKKN